MSSSKDERRDVVGLIRLQSIDDTHLDHQSKTEKNGRVLDLCA